MTKLTMAEVEYVLRNNIGATGGGNPPFSTTEKRLARALLASQASLEQLVIFAVECEREGVAFAPADVLEDAQAALLDKGGKRDTA